MTREEAIEILKRKTTIPNDGESFEDIDEAFDMAIKALEQEPVLDKIRADIERLKHQNTDVSGYRWWNNAINNCLLEIDKYKKESEEKE